VGNNPVNYIDPTGHQCESAQSSVVGCDEIDDKFEGMSDEYCASADTACVVDALIPVDDPDFSMVTTAHKVEIAKCMDLQQADPMLDSAPKCRSTILYAMAIGVVGAVGGVYSLTDPVTGEVVRTGRTNNFAVRRRAHLNNPATQPYRFNKVYETDSYAEQRGLEEELYNRNPNAPLNRIRPISPRNPNAPFYRHAASKFLEMWRGPRGGSE